MRWGRAVILPAAVALLAGAAAAQSGDPVLGPQSLLDRPAPPFEVRRLPDDEPVRLADMRGRVVVLALFSVWCSECRRATTELDRIQQRHRESVAVLAVAADPRDRLEAMLRARPAGYTVAWDEGETRRRYAVRMLPTFVVVDRSGFVRRVLTGASTETLRALDGAVRSLLGPPR